MRVTFLGTGTSHGIPQIGCDCAVCRSNDPRDTRLRPSVLVSDAGANVLVDATPDFRAQALRANIRRVDAALLTHPHADHILGLDELRVFTDGNDTKMPLYGSAETMADIQRIFPYACTEKPAWAGLPRFSLNSVGPDVEFRAASMAVRSLVLTHARMMVFGYQFGRQLAYLTDCSVVPDLAIERIRGVTLLVLDALRHRPHPAHLTLAQALGVVERVRPRLALLTHLCHELGHRATEGTLPAAVRIAYDGLRMEVDDNDARSID